MGTEKVIPVLSVLGTLVAIAASILAILNKADKNAEAQREKSIEINKRISAFLARDKEARSS